MRISFINSTASAARPLLLTTATSTPSRHVLYALAEGEPVIVTLSASLATAMLAWASGAFKAVFRKSSNSSFRLLSSLRSISSGADCCKRRSASSLARTSES